MSMNVLRKYDMNNPISGSRLTLVHYPNKTDHRIHRLTKILKWNELLKQCRHCSRWMPSQNASTVPALFPFAQVQKQLLHDCNHLPVYSQQAPGCPRCRCQQCRSQQWAISFSAAVQYWRESQKASPWYPDKRFSRAQGKRLQQK